MRRPRVLTFCGYYLPAYKGGGPIRSIANMVEWLRDVEFWIVTRDRDLGDTQPFAGIRPGEWQTVGGARVCYLSPSQTSPWNVPRILARIACQVRPDVIYLNSFFSPPFTVAPLLLRQLHLIHPVATIVSPRGELAPGALALKSAKKRLYIRVARILGLYRGVAWQASNAYEKADIERVISLGAAGARVSVAPNLPPRELPDEPRSHARKRPGTARIVFLSRISRKKNLYGALGYLHGLEGVVDFDIAGPVEDREYWDECQAFAQRLPPNIKVRHLGAIPNEQVAELLSRYHLLLLPTLGENFGHVILEALCAGCPILTNDRTPWRNLAADHAGWDLPLSDVEGFRAALRALVDMDDDAWQVWRAGARALGLAYVHDGGVLEANRQLFRAALDGRL